MHGGAPLTCNSGASVHGRHSSVFKDRRQQMVKFHMTGNTAAHSCHLPVTIYTRLRKDGLRLQFSSFHKPCDRADELLITIIDGLIFCVDDGAACLLREVWPRFAWARASPRPRERRRTPGRPAKGIPAGRLLCCRCPLLRLCCCHLHIVHTQGVVCCIAGTCRCMQASHNVQADCTLT
jgi:hypothetical protein